MGDRFTSDREAESARGPVQKRDLSAIFSANFTSEPLPWCTSKSTNATLDTVARWTHRAYAAPIAAEDSKQKPADWPPTAPCGPAWWPGGRIAQNALRASRGVAQTDRTASTTAPAARRAASNE